MFGHLELVFPGKILEVLGFTFAVEAEISAIYQPRTEVSHLEIGQVVVTEDLGQVEGTMGQVAVVSDTKGLRNLDNEEVDHADEAFRDVVLNVPKPGILDLLVHIFVSFTVLGHLQVEEVVFEDFVGSDYVGCLWGHIDPFVEQLIHLEICRIPVSTVNLNRATIDDLINKLLMI